jgi:uncharacterized protein (UPF0262 family)
LPNRRLVRIALEDAPPPPSSYAEADRRQAIDDILKENRFDPEGLGEGMGEGPFSLHLMVREGRLVLDIRDGGSDAPLRVIVLALGPFRRLIKDYLMLVDAHEAAVTDGAMDARVQAIDMGRRGLHNEAAELLTARLEGRVALDFDTARRLFTLIAALHTRI